jgi:hypothetical protein
MNSQKKLPLLFTCLAFSIILITGCGEDEIASGQFNRCTDDELEPGQLISNGNVEAGSTSPCSWWKTDSYGKYNLTSTDQESFSGRKSLNISIQNAHTDAFAYWGQTITTNIPIGMDVTLRAKIKGDLEGEGVSIALRGDDTTSPSGPDAQFISTQYKTKITGQFNWKEYSIKLDNVDSSTQSLTVYLIYLPKTTGHVFFDDISLTY